MFSLGDRRFNRLAVGSVITGFALLAIAFVAGFLALLYAERSTAEVRHTYEVADQISQVELALERSETTVRGDLVQPDPRRVAVFNEQAALMEKGLDRLSQLTADNSVQVRNFAPLKRNILEEMNSLSDILLLTQAGAVDEGRAQFTERLKVAPIRVIRDASKTMRDEEERLLRVRVAAQQDAVQLARVVLLTAGILLLIVAIGATWLVRRYTVDLTRARDRLNILNSDLEGEVAAQTAGLRRANDEIQRFAYIVSHDLRSPLVNVMGFTAELEGADKTLEEFVGKIEAEHPELVDEKVRLAAREDLPESIGFIRSSTQKMDRLINAILALSRQGRRTLTPELLPMTKIVADIIDTLATQAAERGAAVAIDGNLPDITHDRLAIEQIFQNIIENATKYLKPGVPGEIVVRGGSKGSRAIFEIEDNGRGVDQKDHERIFELFRRSGTQDQRGEGIGLAHVRGLAYRLGGTVTIRSALNEGSTFIIDLPKTYAAEGDDQ